MKEDGYSQNTYYTNLMLKLEKLEDKIERLEKIFLSRSSSSEYGNKKVGAEDFSRFLDFDKLKEEKGLE